MLVLTNIVLLTLIVENWVLSSKIKKIQKQIEDLKMENTILYELQKRK
ncbi:MAG: hypothetical protein MJY78_02815 [Fibrobacter sp.]|nr:hypothetical protein [Fibrobacter sp.]